MSHAVARRRLQQREEARQTILHATEVLLAEEGYEAFSIRRLADRCGYAPPTIYHYFGDKLGLISAAVDKCFEGLLESILSVAQADDPVENLRAMARAFVTFGLENPTHYRLLMIPQGDRPPPESAERARERMSQPMQQLAEEGRLRVPDLETAREVVWSMLHGLISLRTARPDHGWSPTLLDAAIQTLIEGLVAPGEK